MKNLVIYVHGKGGIKEEVNHYIPLFTDSDVIGLDYKATNPWEAKEEFPLLLDKYSKNYDSVVIVANSIGAYFVMHALEGKNISKAFFISPLVNMERLILDMMMWANVTEDELYERKKINTSFGETLSWDYLTYVRKHPLKWNIPTHILYGEKDHLTSLETISNFSKEINATLTIMKNGEHYFHLEDQMRFLDEWIIKFYNN